RHPRPAAQTRIVRASVPAPQRPQQAHRSGHTGTAATGRADGAGTRAAGAAPAAALARLACKQKGPVAQARRAQAATYFVATNALAQAIPQQLDAGKKHADIQHAVKPHGADAPG